MQCHTKESLNVSEEGKGPCLYNYKYFTCLSAHECSAVGIHKRELDPLALELQVAVSQNQKDWDDPHPVSWLV